MESATKWRPYTHQSPWCSPNLPADASSGSIPSVTSETTLSVPPLRAHPADHAADPTALQVRWLGGTLPAGFSLLRKWFTYLGAVGNAWSDGLALVIWWGFGLGIGVIVGCRWGWRWRPGVRSRCSLVWWREGYWVTFSLNKIISVDRQHQIKYWSLVVWWGLLVREFFDLFDLLCLIWYL